jgi:hypothetical protein
MLEPSEDTTSGHGLMGGRGFYNRHGWMQAAGIAAALPALARAAGAVPVDPPLVVADYGSSQGRNSLRPMQVTIAGLRARASGAPVMVIHIDQPVNDFASLFGLLNDSPESYLRLYADTYTAAVGRSFFDPVLPPGSVTLGWTSFAAQWLTGIPPEAAGHVSAALAPPDVLGLLHTQAETDWRRFLAARASELRPGRSTCRVGARPRRARLRQHKAVNRTGGHSAEAARERGAALRGRLRAGIHPHRGSFVRPTAGAVR